MHTFKTCSIILNDLNFKHIALDTFFYNLLFQLPDVFRRCIHINLALVSLFFHAIQSSMVGLYHNLCIRNSFWEHLGCVQFYSITSNGEMNSLMAPS